MLPLLKRLWLNTLRANLSRQAHSRSSTVLSLEALEGRLTPSNFYIRPSGDDHNNGLSPNTAWRTINKVNAQVFHAGDTINFEGGATYSGSLLFDTQSGTASNPITITSYNGRATINSGDAGGIALYDTNSFVISNLNFVGTSTGQVAASGISVQAEAMSIARVYIDSVDVSGYGGQGITAYANPNVTLQDLRITRAVVHDEIAAPGVYTCGIAIWGADPSQRSIFGLYIGDTHVYNIQAHVGIYVLNTVGGTIERSVVHDVGYFTGLQGFAAWDSDQIVFQYDESYRNTDLTAVDGHGFLFGNGVTNSIMQYNYAHENSGYGYTVTADLPGRASAVGNTLRYNISENDAQLSPTYASFLVYGDVWNTTIHNNTFFDGLPGRKAVLVWGWTGTGLHFYNNIFEAGDTDYSFQTDLSTQQATAKDLVFQGDAYYSTDGAFRVGFSDRSYSSLTDWQNVTGQEMLGGTPVGYAGDPQLLNPGQGGTIDDPDLLSTLTAYTLQGGSPLAQAGLDLLGLFGIDPGTQDFFGNPLPQGGAFSIGANQSASPNVKGDAGGLTAEQVTLVQAVQSRQAVDLVLMDLAVQQKHPRSAGPIAMFDLTLL